MVQIQMLPRPSERVRQYVLHEFANPDNSTRLPTMRQLASELDVSLATVQQVYRQLKKEGHISTRAGDGSFLVRMPHKGNKQHLSVVLNYIPPEGALQASDLGKIYGGMLHASIERGLQMSFAPLREMPTDSQELAKTIAENEADGVIIFPTGTEKTLVQCCEANSIPYTCLQPPSRTLHANYVSAEHFDQGYLIGQAFATAGRKRVAFFSAGKPTQSTSAWELLSGLTCGLIEEAGEENIMLFTPPAGMVQKPEALHEAIAQWLRERRDNLPDAIYSHRANYTSSILQTMSEFGLKAPDGYALITHADIYAPSPVNAQVTRVSASFLEVGRALVNMLLERIHTGGQNMPPVRLQVIFAGGTTTTAVENEILGVQQTEEQYD